MFKYLIDFEGFKKRVIVNVNFYFLRKSVI